MKKVIVIGAGPGGYFVADILSKGGLDVTIVEKNELGGTCLNVGCIPTKVLLDHISIYEHVLEQAKKKDIFKFDGGIEVNQESLRKYQKEVIKQLKQGIEKALNSGKVKIVNGEAKFIAKDKVLVTKNGKSMEIDFDEAVIATGSKPRVVPTFEFDRKLVVSSDDVWDIPRVPKKLLIVGTGPIGIEFARVFKALGSEVRMSEIKEQICPILDKELSDNLQRSLKRRGIKTTPNIASKQIEKKKSTVKAGFLSTEDSKYNTEEEFDQVLIAVGREPNIKKLDLSKAGVELDEAGFIKVDKFLKTNVENIWAIGDITNYPQLAHTARFQAKVAANNILNPSKQIEFDSRFIPSCIYGYPEIAFVGKTEEELIEEKNPYTKGKAFFLSSGKAKASGLTEGMVKILAGKETRKILGAHIIGPEASNLIHELTVAMQNDLIIDQIANTIHAHPTYSETVYEAIENCIGSYEYAVKR